MGLDGKTSSNHMLKEIKIADIKVGRWPL